ncbi:MAG: transcription antitermination factor NusB [Phycisphaerales bacterium JB050]
MPRPSDSSGPDHRPGPRRGKLRNAPVGTPGERAARSRDSRRSRDSGDRVRVRPGNCSPARERVLTLVTKQVPKFPDLAISTPGEEGLSERDAAFAHALYDIVIRRWNTLKWCVDRHLSRDWYRTPDEARAALLCGAAQILFMRSVPAFAAVNETVEWTKYNAGRAAGGMVNAVLRKLIADLRRAEPEAAKPENPDALFDDEGRKIDPQAAPKETFETDNVGRLFRATWSNQRDELPMEDGTALVLAGPLLPSDPHDRLAIVTSTPSPLLREWVKATSLREARPLAIHGLTTPPTILNTSAASDPLPDVCIVHDAPGHHVFTGSRAELTEMLRDRKDLWVQDPASSLAVQSVLDLTPDIVIDACAGLGTKTRQLAAAFPNATIIATDIDRPRYDSLKRSMEGVPNVRVIPYVELVQHHGAADLVLLDVPCSNTGVLSRRVEAKYRTSEERTAELTGLQRQIIADAIPLLRPRGQGKPGGALLYSTCSLDPRENEEIARWVTKWHSFDVEREHRRVPSGGPGRPATEYSDGSYAVLLR